MIKKTLSIIGFLALSNTAMAYDQAFTAKSMQEFCSSNDTKSTEYITCISNINGYMEGMVHSKVFEELENDTVQDKNDETLRLHEVCLASDVSNYQLSKIFLKYISQNPEYLHRDFFSVFYESMKNAFPCAQ